MIAASSGGSVVLVIILTVVGIALYFLPTIIAGRRRHHQFNAIAVINFFLGWSVIGWVVALAMAVSATPAARR